MACPTRLHLGGPSETFVIDQQGRLFSWGANHSGQLGIGQQVGSFLQTPSHVKPIHDPVAEIISGGTFTISRLASWPMSFFTALNINAIKEKAMICNDNTSIDVYKLVCFKVL